MARSLCGCPWTWYVPRPPSRSPTARAGITRSSSTAGAWPSPSPSRAYASTPAGSGSHPAVPRTRRRRRAVGHRHRHRRRGGGVERGEAELRLRGAPVTRPCQAPPARRSRRAPRRLRPAGRPLRRPAHLAVDRPLARLRTSWSRRCPEIQTVLTTDDAGAGPRLDERDAGTRRGGDRLQALGLPYRPGDPRAAWRKVRSADTLDAELVGVVGPERHPWAAVVDLPDGRRAVTSPRLTSVTASQLGRAVAGQLGESVHGRRTGRALAAVGGRAADGRGPRADRAAHVGAVRASAS